MAETKVRDYINTYGKQYGYSNDDIGWDANTGNVMLGGQALIKPDSLKDGSSFVNDSDVLKSAIDNLAKNNGMYNPNKYSENIDTLLNSILNPEKFTYDAQTDPNYQALKGQYENNGKTAMTNTMSTAASMTGGIPSSYAVSAGNQAYNNNMQQLEGMVPQLYQLAYGMYQDKQGQQSNALNTLLNLDNRDYSRNRDVIGDKNAQTQWDYGVNRDTINDATAKTQWDYGVNRDNISDTTAKEQWDYGVGRDAISDKRYEDSLKTSGGSGGTKTPITTAAEDYSGFNAIKSDFGKGGARGSEAISYLASHKDEMIAKYGKTAFDMATEYYYNQTQPQEKPKADEAPNPYEQDNIQIWYADYNAAKDKQAWLSENSSYMTPAELKFYDDKISKALAKAAEEAY